MTVGLDNSSGASDSKENAHTELEDEKGYSQIFTSLFGKENLQLGWDGNIVFEPGVGITNDGNSCYCNAVLRALFKIPIFVNWLIADTEHRGSCKGCIICWVWNAFAASQTSNTPISYYTMSIQSYKKLPITNSPNVNKKMPVNFIII